MDVYYFFKYIMYKVLLIYNTSMTLHLICFSTAKNLTMLRNVCVCNFNVLTSY